MVNKGLETKKSKKITNIAKNLESQMSHKLEESNNTKERNKSAEIDSKISPGSSDIIEGYNHQFSNIVDMINNQPVTSKKKKKPRNLSFEG